MESVLLLERKHLPPHLAALPCVDCPTPLRDVLLQLEDAGEVWYVANWCAFNLTIPNPTKCLRFGFNPLTTPFVFCPFKTPPAGETWHQPPFYDGWECAAGQTTCVCSWPPYFWGRGGETAKTPQEIWQQQNEVRPQLQELWGICAAVQAESKWEVGDRMA